MSRKIEIVSDESVVKSASNPIEEIANGLFGVMSCGATLETEREVTVQDDEGNTATGRGDSSAEAVADAVKNLG